MNSTQHTGHQAKAESVPNNAKVGSISQKSSGMHMILSTFTSSRKEERSLMIIMQLIGLHKKLFEEKRTSA